MIQHSLNKQITIEAAYVIVATITHSITILAIFDTLWVHNTTL